MTVAVRITDSYLAMADSLFDTRNRYLRKVATGAGGMVFARGKTIDIISPALGSTSSMTVFWRWRVGSATFCAAPLTFGGTTYAAPDGFNQRLDISL